MSDPYTYAGSSRVLVNKAGIKKAAELQAFEQEVSSARSDELRLGKAVNRRDFGSSHIAAIHNFLFHDVYAWAGQFRTVNISKDGVEFAHANKVGDVLKTVQTELRSANFLRGQSKDQFVGGIAKAFGALQFAHPFREGNQKTARVYLEQLAKQAGFAVDFSKVSRSEWVEMSNAALKNDLSKAVATFAEVSRPLRAIAFESMSERDALLRHPELVGAYTQKFEARPLTEIAAQLERGEIPGGASVKSSVAVMKAHSAFEGVRLVGASDVPKALSATVSAKTEHHVLLKDSAEKLAVLVNKQALGRDVEAGDVLRLSVGLDRNLGNGAAEQGIGQGMRLNPDNQRR
jgi:cell filamentation protein